MSYPATVPTSPQGYDLGNNNAGTGQYGFTFGGVDYLFAFQGGLGASLGDLKLHAFSSSDTVQSWTELDSANAPFLDNVVSFGYVFTVALDAASSRAVVLFVKAHASGGNPVIDGMGYKPFSLISNTWGSEVDFPGLIPGYLPTAFVQGATTMSLDVIVCGANDYMMLYSGATELISAKNYGRMWVVPFTGSAFGTPAELPGQAGNAITYFGTGACYDSTNNVEHYFFQDNQGFPVFNLIHVGRSHGGSFASSQIIAANLYQGGTFTGEVSDPIIYTGPSGSEIGVAALCFDGGVGNGNMNWIHGAVAVSPAWSTTLVTSNSSFLPATQVLNQTNKMVSAGVGNVRFIGFFLDDNSLDHTNNGNELTESNYRASTGDLVVAWTYNPGSPNHLNGSINYAAGPANTLVFGSPATLWGTGNVDYAAQWLFIYGPSVPVVVPPTCSINAVPSSIVPGQIVTLTWTTTNTPTTATISGIGSVNPAGGSTTVTPLVNTTYVLTVSNTAGTSTCQTTVTIGAPVPVAPVGGVCAPHVDCTLELYKNPIDSDLYTFDWSSFIGTDTITASNWAVFPAGVTIVGSSFTATTTSVTLGGGVAPNVYLLRNGIATKGGRALMRSARLFLIISTVVPAAPLQ